MRGQSVNQVRTHFLQLLASVVSHALQALERDNNNELLLLEHSMMTMRRTYSKQTANPTLSLNIEKEEVSLRNRD